MIKLLDSTETYLSERYDREELMEIFNALRERFPADDPDLTPGEVLDLVQGNTRDLADRRPVAELLGRLGELLDALGIEVQG